MLATMEIRFDGDVLTVKLVGWERLWAFSPTTTFAIPIDHVSAVSTEAPRGFGLRAPGTSIPGLIRAGTYYTRAGCDFWYVTRKMRGSVLSLSLRGEKFDRMVLGFEGSAAVAERLRARLSARVD